MGGNVHQRNWRFSMLITPELYLAVFKILGFYGNVYYEKFKLRFSQVQATFESRRIHYAFTFSKPHFSFYIQSINTI